MRSRLLIPAAVVSVVLAGSTVASGDLPSAKPYGAAPPSAPVGAAAPPPAAGSARVFAPPLLTAQCGDRPYPSCASLAMVTSSPSGHPPCRPGRPPAGRPPHCPPPPHPTPKPTRTPPPKPTRTPK